MAFDFSAHQMNELWHKRRAYDREAVQRTAAPNVMCPIEPSKCLSDIILLILSSAMAIEDRTADSHLRDNTRPTTFCR